MKITGSYTVDAPQRAFFDALHDPAVLARTLPGCQSLEVLGDDVYAATVTAGVASVRGTYSGRVQLLDKVAPESYRLTAACSGAPGTIQAEALVRLEVDGDTTIVHYDADAVVGGMIGGVGQRMIAGAARRTAGEFFSAVADEVLHGPAPVEREPAPATVGEVGGHDRAPGEVGRVLHGIPAAEPSTGRRPTELFAAFVLGAAVALVGVLIGRRTARTGG